METLSALHSMGSYSGIWPASNNDIYYKYKMWLRFILASYFILGICWYPVELIKDPKYEFVELVDGVYTVFCVLNLGFGYCVTFFIRNNVLKQLKVLTNFDNFGYPRNLQKLYKTVNQLTFVFHVYMYIATIFLCLKELVFMTHCEEKYRAVGREFLCGYLTPLSYPTHDIKTGILWYLHIPIACYSLIYVGVGGATFACAIITSVELVIVRIDHLKLMISECFNSRSQFEKKSNFRECCLYHQYIISLTQDINNVYIVLTTPVLMNYSVLIGLQLMCLSLEFSMKPLINLIGWLSALGLACVSSDRLAEKGRSIGTVLYCTSWYEADVKLRRDIGTMLMRTQRPMFIQSGPFGTLSHESLKMIMKGSYTYATMRSNI